MKWKKLGKIFDPTKFDLPGDCFEFAQSPQTLVFEDFVRIYFSTRKKDVNGKFLSHIAFLEIDKGFKKIIRVSKHTVIPLGELGAFDEHGIFPINPLRVGNKIYAYTCGWSRRISVPVETSTGLAISNDEGLTFEKVGSGPVLSNSLHEPMLVGDSFVQFYNNQFHMWYIFGKKWILASQNEPPARVYKIAHAISANGIDWKKDEAKQIIPDALDENECQALPTVIKIGDTFHMYFCFREATDFRTNPLRGYRIGYASSKDLVDWKRDDEKGGFHISSSGWDSEMNCYPHIFGFNDKVYLLYNGNQFGKYGFGIAELQEI
ncbi:MAG: hypothetical protein ABI666_02215 [Ferruginibacter sp.]